LPTLSGTVWPPALHSPVALLRGMLGLRIAPNDTETVDLEMAGGGHRHLPVLRKFTQVWTARHHMETHLEEPLPSSIQLILGVMTVAQESQYRQVVRQTWLRQEGVCYWSRKPQAGCSVYAAFVVGSNGTGNMHTNISDEELEASHKEPGMLVLDIVENMDGGKSCLWFSTALETFPWATHIAKIDMDTYPFLHKLLHRMNLYQDCASKDGPYEFMGTLTQGRKGRKFWNPCNLSECAASASDSVSLDGRFTYMQGGFYIMSRPLVERIHWTGSCRGIEDDLIGRRVDAAAGKQHFCVAIRRPDAWYHRILTRKPGYANNFTA